MTPLHSDLRVSGFSLVPLPRRSLLRTPASIRQGSMSSSTNRPLVCTADELHHVRVPNSDWKLALWLTYEPPPEVPGRNHPLLLWTGVGTNAIGYDLSPDGGLRDRNGTFLAKSNVPILAIAGDQDLIWPPEAVYETAKLIPQHLVKYKVFDEPDGPHYAHYDIVGGRLFFDQQDNI